MRTRGLDWHRLSSERGSVSLAALFGAVVLIAALLLVVNTGAHTNAKIRLQNASDAAAVSAGTLIARTLNVISLNNVTQTRLLAIALLIPALDRGIDRGMRTVEAELPGCAALTVGAVECELYLEAELAYLEGLKTIVTPLRPLAEPPSGALWTLMRALGKESEVLAKSMPIAAGAEVMRIARQNGATSALLLTRSARAGLTAVPAVPVRVGTFRDLCDAARNGSPTEHRRGYFALYEYPLNVGPLEYYTTAVLDNLVGWAVNWNTGIQGTVRSSIDSEFTRLCSSADAVAPGDWRPTPIVLREDSGDGTTPPTRALLEYVVLATGANATALGGRLWASPLGDKQTAYAQIRVHNRTAFDLFTQDWRTKLTPALALEDGTMTPAKDVPNDGSVGADGDEWRAAHSVRQVTAWVNNH